MQYKEKCMDLLRLKKVKLEKMIGKAKRIKDYAVFERDQKIV